MGISNKLHACHDPGLTKIRHEKCLFLWPNDDCLKIFPFSEPMAIFTACQPETRTDSNAQTPSVGTTVAQH